MQRDIDVEAVAAVVAHPRRRCTTRDARAIRVAVLVKKKKERIYICIKRDNESAPVKGGNWI